MKARRPRNSAGTAVAPRQEGQAARPGPAVCLRTRKTKEPPHHLTGTTPDTPTLRGVRSRERECGGCPGAGCTACTFTGALRPQSPAGVSATEGAAEATQGVSPSRPCPQVPSPWQAGRGSLLYVLRGHVAQGTLVSDYVCPSHSRWPFRAEIPTHCLTPDTGGWVTGQMCSLSG